MSMLDRISRDGKEELSEKNKLLEIEGRRAPMRIAGDADDSIPHYRYITASKIVIEPITKV